MQKIIRTRKSQYRLQFGNFGKCLVMEPPAPDPQAVIPEDIPPRLVTVGVQYDAPPLDPLNATGAHPLPTASSSSSPLPSPIDCKVNGSAPAVTSAANGQISFDSSVFDSPDQTLLPHPLKPSVVGVDRFPAKRPQHRHHHHNHQHNHHHNHHQPRHHRRAMEDSVTTTEEYDMADGGLGKHSPCDSVSDTDSLDSDSPPPINPRTADGSLKYSPASQKGKSSGVGGKSSRNGDQEMAVLNSADHDDRVSVDLADLSLTAATNGEALPRGISEASDSGFSRSVCSDGPEKDSESGASDKSSGGQVFDSQASPEGVFESGSVASSSDVTTASSLAGGQPDEGIDLASPEAEAAGPKSELELNGSVEPPPTPSGSEAAHRGELVDTGAEFPEDQRRNSGASLNESISSSHSSGGHSTENTAVGANSGSSSSCNSSSSGTPTPAKSAAASSGGNKSDSNSINSRSAPSTSRRAVAPGQRKSPLAARRAGAVPNNSSSEEANWRGPRKGKSRFSHVVSRIDSGQRSATTAAAKKAPTEAETACAEAEAAYEGMKENVEAMEERSVVSPENARESATSPTKKRVHFENCDDTKENEHCLEDEEEFVIHPGPGYDDSLGGSNGGESQQRIVSFQEPRSLVKQYIRGRSAGSRPRIIKQTTIEVAELARRPQKAIPIPQASASGAAPNIPVKQTIASKKRLEKLRQESQAQMERLQAESAYMTPLQRKEAEVKELRRQLGEAYYIIEQREVELDVFHHEKDREIRDAVEEKDELVKDMEESVDIMQDELDSVKADNGELMERQSMLEEQIKNLKEEAQKRELRHQNLYLQMYRKGRDSALFERQDELEKLAIEEPDSVSKEELLKKLADTQHELEHWQRVRLTEHYDEAAKPETEADAKLNFLKDSMYHYLTETKKDPLEQHLKAIIQIFQFTEVQMRSINKSIEERKRKGKI